MAYVYVCVCMCMLDNGSCMVCMFVEGVKGYRLTIFFSVSGWECLSLDAVSLSVRCCCFPSFADCMHIYNTMYLSTVLN